MNFSKFAEINSICKVYKIENYTINTDGSVDVDGDVSIKNYLSKLPINFGKVTGDFKCSNNRLTTLKGCPSHVGKSFFCDDNHLETLEFSPISVGGGYYCDTNMLISLEGCPEEIKSHFHCQKNRLKSLYGGPKNVGGDFFCQINLLTSLEGCPKKVNRFLAGDNLFENLEGSPIEVMGDFNVGESQLKTLKGGPSKVGGYYSFSHTYVGDLIDFPSDYKPNNIFFNNTPFCEILDLFISCKNGCDSLKKCSHIKDLNTIIKIINLLNEYKVIDGNNISLMGIEKIYYELLDENYDVEIKKLPNEVNFKYYNVY